MQKAILDLTKTEQTIEITEDTQLLGLFVGHNDEEVKSRLNIIHRKPNLTSRINIKAVVFDKANFDLEAKLLIDDGASNSDTYLKVDALIMDDGARARAVPSLEIKEDNVKGGHGATVGQVNREQVHYMMSRGFSKPDAEKLIVEAFIQDIKSQLQ
jgi:Fe-S cluster assembly protein SufD